MLRINQLKLKPGDHEQALERKVVKTLHTSPENILQIKIKKQSLDARKKPDIYYVYTVDVAVKNEKEILKKQLKQVTPVKEIKYRLPAAGMQPLSDRPVIVGCGPAGLFCAYLLAKQGYQPRLIERGAPVEERIYDVNQFWESNLLNPNSNVQFGEGGAGTFSDGKLNTLVNDKSGRNQFVLETLVAHGAPESILYEQKPHIGTDILAAVVSRMRHSIEQFGGEVLFHTQLTDICFDGGDGKAPDAAVRLKKIRAGEKELAAEVLVLAIGHSARDTFEMLDQRQVPMVSKAFAVGVRIEHAQALIDQFQYGLAAAAKQLPPATYKLAEQLENNRGVYSFCMCPGGYVVNASSEPGRIAVNGMSYHDRDGSNANSAIVVTVTEKDFAAEMNASPDCPLDSPLLGMQFQRKLEETAYQLGNGKIPVQRFEDFCENQDTTAFGSITPSIKGSWQTANLRRLFPEVITSSLEQGIKKMDHKIHGFAHPDSILSGVESRTSSPVRILRNDGLESDIAGLYPCGEGAGYAGGITSAAMDGMKVAEAIISKYKALR